MCAVCALCTQPLLLPLAVVCVRAGKLVAYLCRDPSDEQIIAWFDQGTGFILT